MITVATSQTREEMMEGMVAKANYRARIRRMERRHINTFFSFIDTANICDVSEIVYNPVGLSHKPGSYMGSADCTYVRYTHADWGVHRGEMVSKWVFRVTFASIEEAMNWQPPAEFGGELWTWKRIGVVWYGN